MSAVAILFPIEVGDKIKLNSRAHKWTRGKEFTVEEIKSWGVICSAKVGYESQPDFYVMRGVAYYRAAWHEIEEPC